MQSVSYLPTSLSNQKSGEGEIFLVAITPFLRSRTNTATINYSLSNIASYIHALFSFNQQQQSLFLLSLLQTSQSIIYFTSYPLH